MASTWRWIRVVLALSRVVRNKVRSFKRYHVFVQVTLIVGCAGFKLYMNTVLSSQLSMWETKIKIPTHVISVCNFAHLSSCLMHSVTSLSMALLAADLPADMAVSSEAHSPKSLSLDIS